MDLFAQGIENGYSPLLETGGCQAGKADHVTGCVNVWTGSLESVIDLDAPAVICFDADLIQAQGFRVPNPPRSKQHHVRGNSAIAFELDHA